MSKIQTHHQDSQHQKPKLLDQVRAKIRLKHYKYSNGAMLCRLDQALHIFHGKRHPLEMDEREVEQSLTHLAVEKKVAASTQNQALSALVFLYREVLNKDIGWMDNLVRAQQHQRLPVVLAQKRI